MLKSATPSHFSHQLILKKICRQSRTCPTCAEILRSKLFPRLPTSSLNCCRWFCHQPSKMDNWNWNQIRARTEGKSLWLRTPSWPWSEGTPRLLSSAFLARWSNVFFSLKALLRHKVKRWKSILAVKVHTGEEIVRERALRLVHTKLKTNTSDLLNREAQAQVGQLSSDSPTVLNHFISFSVDCRDQESVCLSNCHWWRVSKADGDSQHDLFAKVYRRTGGG